MRFAFVTGTLKEHQGKRRERIEQLFRDGKIDILIATGILDEGFDAPAIRFLILAGGGLAEHRQIQRLGRGQRADEGKHELVAFDFFDRGHYLGKHSQARYDTYRQEPAYNVHVISAADLEEMLK